MNYASVLHPLNLRKREGRKGREVFYTVSIGYQTNATILGNVAMADTLGNVLSFFRHKPGLAFSILSALV